MCASNYALNAVNHLFLRAVAAPVNPAGIQNVNKGVN